MGRPPQGPIWGILSDSGWSLHHLRFDAAFQPGKANGRAERTASRDLAPALTEADRPAGVGLGGLWDSWASDPRSPSACRSCRRRPENPSLASQVGRSPAGRCTRDSGDTPLDHTKDPTPGRWCISCGSGGSGAARDTYMLPAAHGPSRAGRWARPHAALSPRATRPAAALHGPAPVSPQAGLPLCAGRAPRPRHWPARPGGQPLPGSPHAYA